MEQVPPTHVLPLVLVQSTQVAAALPQAVSLTLSGVTQLAPLQQPVQVLTLQVPPQPSGAPAHLPSQRGWQQDLVALEQVKPCRAQLVQGCPWLPQAASVRLVTQFPWPSQHPPGQLAGVQVPATQKPA